MSTVYSGLSTFGRINSDINLIIFSVVGIIFFIVGIFVAKHNSRHTEYINADIIAIQLCTTKNCTVTVGYNVNGKRYTATVNTNSPNVTLNSSMGIYYDPNNPSDVTLTPLPKWLGYTFIGIGITLPIIAYIMYYFTHKSKEFAAVQGGLSLMNDIREL